MKFSVGHRLASKAEQPRRSWFRTVIKGLSAFGVLATVVPVTVAVAGPGVASAYVSGCSLSRNWVNTNGPSVTGSPCSTGGGEYGEFFATYSDGASYVRGWWWNNNGYWVEGTRSWQWVADSDTADVVLIDYCWQCTFHLESDRGAWITSEY